MMRMNTLSIDIFFIIIIYSIIAIHCCYCYFNCYCYSCFDFHYHFSVVVSVAVILIIIIPLRNIYINHQCHQQCSHHYHLVNGLKDKLSVKVITLTNVTIPYTIMAFNKTGVNARSSPRSFYYNPLCHLPADPLSQT